MNKTIHLIRGMEKETYPAFSARILNLVKEYRRKNDPLRISVVLTDERPPAFSVIPYKRMKIASVSVHGESAQDPDFFASTEGWYGSYLVTEAIPVGYQKDWPDGEITPGICLLTLFNKRRGIDEQTFLERWHNGHTPLSLNIHPLWNYNRNVIKMALTEGSQKLDGIVEEQMKTRQELLNPFLFFGPFPKIFARLLLVYRDTKSFIDYPTMETYLTHEYVIKSSS